MARRAPRLFSKQFGLDASQLEEAGVFDPTLNADTRLFIDPILLPSSKHRQFADTSTQRLRSHFENIIKVLATDSAIGLRTATRMLTFAETSHTCLGYGAGTAGAGFGKKKDGPGGEHRQGDCRVGDPRPRLVHAAAVD